MNLGGRGNCKTRCGAEFIRDEVNGGARKVALIGPTNADVRDVMLQGDNDTPGLLDVFPPNQRPLYIPSKRFVRFHTGAVATTYSAEKAARLRGPQHDRYWADEVGAWEEAGKGRLRKTWDMLMFGLRRGPHPRGICTTTPKPIPWFEEMLADPATVSTRGTTFDNEAFLAPSFFKNVTRLYLGTHLGNQELMGLILEEVLGALWAKRNLVANRVDKAPPKGKGPLDLQLKIMGVDPSVAGDDVVEDGSRKRDDCGIVVVGRQGPKRPFAKRFVLGDYSLNAKPEDWAKEIVRVFYIEDVDVIAAEANQGGDLVRWAIEAVDPKLKGKVKMITAVENKKTRAEPVALAYARNEVAHVGTLAELEKEQTTWVPDGSGRSPNRIDALVHAVRFDMTSVVSGGHAA